MKIIIGSKNKTKVEALAEIIKDYPHLESACVEAVEVGSGVSDQPKTLDETMEGAMNRAKNAFGDCDYSFGLESGLMIVPKTKTGYMDVCACAIYDGRDYFFGLSSAWEPSPKVIELIDAGLNMAEAAVKSGLSDNPEIGAAEGLIGVMTKGRLTRKDYTKEAIRTALIHLERA